MIGAPGESSDSRASVADLGGFDSSLAGASEAACKGSTAEVGAALGAGLEVAGVAGASPAGAPACCVSGLAPPRRVAVAPVLDDEGFDHGAALPPEALAAGAGAELDCFAELAADAAPPEAGFDQGALTPPLTDEDGVAATGAGAGAPEPPAAASALFCCHVSGADDATGAAAEGAGAGAGALLLLPPTFHLGPGPGAGAPDLAAGDGAGSAAGFGALAVGETFLGSLLEAEEGAAADSELSVEDGAGADAATEGSSGSGLVGSEAAAGGFPAPASSPLLGVETTTGGMAGGAGSLLTSAALFAASGAT